MLLPMLQFLLSSSVLPAQCLPLLAGCQPHSLNTGQLAPISTSYPSYLPMVAVSSPICSSTTLPVCPPYLLPSFQFPLIASQSFETDLAPSSSCLSSVMIRSLTPPLQTSTPKMFWSHLMAPTLAEDRVPHHSDSWFSPKILATWASILFDMRANTANPNEASPWVSLFPGVKFSNIQALTSSQAV
jgi:hypothetical protein